MLKNLIYNTGQVCREGETYDCQITDLDSTKEEVTKGLYISIAENELALIAVDSNELWQNDELFLKYFRLI